MEKFVFPSDKNILKCCGIYGIRNILNSKIYVGSSKQILKRMGKHCRSLKSNTHWNLHLQQAFNKENTVFEICLLETCSEVDLITKEIHWSEFYQSHDRTKGYNQCPISDSGGHNFTNDIRSKISKALLKGKSVFMCEKESGNRLIRFDSLFSAGEYIFKSGCSTSSMFCIRMRISEAARNIEANTGYGRKSRRTSAYGYKWEIL